MKIGVPNVNIQVPNVNVEVLNRKIAVLNLNVPVLNLDARALSLKISVLSRKVEVLNVNVGVFNRKAEAPGASVEVLKENVLAFYTNRHAQHRKPRDLRSNLEAIEEGCPMDEADLLKMDEATLYKRLSIILDKVKRIDDDDPNDEADPRIDRLLDEADFITEQLDPIMRERFRHDPAKLAEWDDIMHMCDDLEEKVPANSEDSHSP
jgi:hypothetical protein